MKKNVKTSLFLMLLLMLLSCAGSSAQKKQIAAEELPLKARVLLSSHFAEEKPDYILYEKDGFDVEYMVRFLSGTEIEFNKNGEWKEVSANSIPAGLFPAAISDYLRANYPDHAAVKADRSRKGYEIELANGLELKFDKKGKFLRLD